jgi:hypothetical protein
MDPFISRLEEGSQFHKLLDRRVMALEVLSPCLTNLGSKGIAKSFEVVVFVSLVGDVSKQSPGSGPALVVVADPILVKLNSTEAVLVEFLEVARHVVMFQDASHTIPTDEAML